MINVFILDALAAAGLQPSLAAALAAQLVGSGGGGGAQSSAGPQLTSVLHVSNLNDEV